MTALAQVAVLTLVYALALASFEPLDLATGAMVSVACVLGLRRLHATEGLGAGDLARRLVGAPLMVAVLARDVVSGTFAVGLTVLGLRSAEDAGIVTVPFAGRSERGVAATAILMSLTPGELTVEVDWDREVMLVHALDAGDGDALRERYRRFYERYQRRVFP